jgi:MFS family permease
MGGRFVLGFGVAITSTAGPAYASEMAHPAYRGVLTGIFNTFWFVGGIPGTFVPFGTSTMAGTKSWRIPIWLQMVFAGIVLFCSPFIPETPRWLIANDRHEEALDTMAKYHGEGSRDSPIVQLEYKEMVEDISVTGSDKRWWDYSELFNSKEQRYRTMLVVSMAFFGQWVGNGPVSYYYPTMLQGAGITDNHQRLLLNGMQNVVSFAGAIFGAFYTDKWGRRPQLL